MVISEIKMVDFVLDFEVMGLIPVGDSDFSLSHARVMYCRLIHRAQNPPSLFHLSNYLGVPNSANEPTIILYIFIPFPISLFYILKHTIILYKFDLT